MGIVNCFPENEEESSNKRKRKVRRKKKRGKRKAKQRADTFGSDLSYEDPETMQPFISNILTPVQNSPVVVTIGRYSAAAWKAKDLKYQWFAEDITVIQSTFACDS